MDEFKFTVKIDGEEYTPKQLKRIEYERTLHVLHEMKGLGGGNHRRKRNSDSRGYQLACTGGGRAGAAGRQDAFERTGNA